MDKYSELKFRDDRFSVIVNEGSFGFLLDALYDELNIDFEFRNNDNVKKEILETLGHYFLFYLSFKNNTPDVFELLKENGFVISDIENTVSDDLLYMIRNYVDHVLSEINFKTELTYSVLGIPGVGIILKSGENIWKYLYRKVTDGSV